jgi:tetratricopeptide (TPR) repeat protein
VERDPKDHESWSGLGNVDLARGDARAAAEHQERALAIVPGYANAHANLGRARESLGDFAGAEAAYRAALTHDPDSQNALSGLGDLLVARGSWREGIDSLRRLARLAPDDRAIARNLAWWLATCPDPDVRDPRAALDLVATDRDDARLDAQALDTLAAVLAANGRFDEARAAVGRALVLLRRDGPREPIPEVEQRAALYDARRAYVLPP